MQLKGKKVLVTGATGFIGGHVVEALQKTGAKLFCVIRKPNPKSYFYKLGLNKKAILIKCDLSQAGQVRQLLSKNQFDFIFHLAGILRPKNIQEAFLGNVGPTINLLEGVKGQKSLKGILFASSVRSKPEDLGGQNLEKLMLRPYDFSKSAADLIVQSYISNYKLPAAIVRYANVFGPGDNLVKPLRLTSEIIHSLKSNRFFSPKGDPKNKVDFVFVKDVAKSFILAAENIKKIKYRTVKLKPIAKYSIQDWAKKIITTVKANKPKTALEKAIIETFDW